MFRKSRLSHPKPKGVLFLLSWLSRPQPLKGTLPSGHFLADLPSFLRCQTYPSTPWKIGNPEWTLDCPLFISTHRGDWVLSRPILELMNEDNWIDQTQFRPSPAFPISTFTTGKFSRSKTPLVFGKRQLLSGSVPSLITDGTAFLGNREHWEQLWNKAERWMDRWSSSLPDLSWKKNTLPDYHHRSPLVCVLNIFLPIICDGFSPSPVSDH